MDSFEEAKGDFTMKTVIASLNGVDNGIAVESISQIGGRKFVKYKENLRLFKSLDLARVTCKEIVQGCKIIYYIVYDKTKKILLSDCYKIDNVYEYIDKENDTIYIFKDEITHKVVQAGYFVFEDGDTLRCDKKYGYKRVKQLMGYITDMASYIVSNNGPISRIVKKGNSELILHIKNTTAAIHVVTNSKLMDINQARKASGDRVIPFIKEFDKFTTLYVFATKDTYEPSRIKSNDIMSKTIEEMVLLLQENIPETNPKYVPVEFSGYINIMEV